MEFCGGGSLQEIYHGEGQDSRPQRATDFSPPLRQHGALNLGPSPLDGCVTLKETLPFSGLCILNCAGRGCVQHFFHLSNACCFPHPKWPGRVQHIP